MAKSKCENCLHFDGSKHEKDARTAHAGICKQWTEITFKNQTCKWHFSVENLPSDKIFLPDQQKSEQLNLFK